MEGIAYSAVQNQSSLQQQQQQQTYPADVEDLLHESGRRSVRPRLLGCVMITAIWVFAIWFAGTVYFLLTDAAKPIVLRKGNSRFDERWYYALLPPMYIPVVIVFAYVNWLSLKFFKHN